MAYGLTGKIVAAKWLVLLCVINLKGVGDYRGYCYMNC